MCESMTEMNPTYVAIAFGSILTALDKMGIKPSLILRQSSVVLEPLAGFVTSSSGVSIPKDLDEYAELLDVSIKYGNACSDIKSIHSGNSIKSNITDCMFMPIAEFAKTLGYDSCPVCIVNLIGSSMFKGFGLGEVSSFKTETTGNVCSIEISLIEE